MKNVVKCYKHFFSYFNALETYSDTLEQLEFKLEKIIEI